jgi:hypothetical protein
MANGDLAHWTLCYSAGCRCQWRFGAGVRVRREHRQAVAVQPKGRGNQEFPTRCFRWRRCVQDAGMQCMLNKLQLRIVHGAGPTASESLSACSADWGSKTRMGSKRGTLPHIVCSVGRPPEAQWASYALPTVPRVRCESTDCVCPSAHNEVSCSSDIYTSACLVYDYQSGSPHPVISSSRVRWGHDACNGAPLFLNAAVGDGVRCHTVPVKVNRSVDNGGALDTGEVKMRVSTVTSQYQWTTPAGWYSATGRRSSCNTCKEDYATGSFTK